ncbi:sorbosone dehydrogenase family protein [Saccharopolyspora sp. 6M]|uniref:PQQ-dependent sugar dehydrogenase n=1 Tax=Saccharopolyspora sp. 6M TaxID=2877237 RepID=UPI001CD1EAD8|nr:PQQ-dependent sugar dehydrogenase [Saccharopolyspora sp. 6M]MCA1225587.1 PQQ-dependent sugar dehydrogenase [Saccharopolyspora sp. 6M]
MAAQRTSPAGRRPRARTAGALLAAIALGGCAQFPDEHPGAWRDQPSLEPQAGPQPLVEQPAPPPPPPGQPTEDVPAVPIGCIDPDPAVVATCLDPVGAITVLPDGRGALVGERATGRILRVEQDAEPVEIARVPVDRSGGGGLTGLALSPSYQEDELVYAYASVGGENQVLRVAPGDSPKPVLTGIPKGSTGNAGALLDDGRGALLVATGDAGDRANAANPGSLAGKVLRIDGFGAPAAGNPDPKSRVVASGVSDPGGLCGAAETGGYWLTDRGATRDALHRVEFGTALGEPAWSWPDRPGVAGCAAGPASVVVALTDAAALYALNPGPDGTFTGQPAKVMEKTYGRFSAAANGPDGLLWLGTSNKSGGAPVPSDDRAIRIEPPSGDTGKD